MAHCIPVTNNAIRVQLPGGDRYAPAFDQAASKTGARCGLPPKHAKALTKMIAAGVAALNRVGATMITLEMTVHDDSISVELVGKGCAKPTKRASSELAKLAKKHASAFSTSSTTSALTLTFDV